MMLRIIMVAVYVAAAFLKQNCAVGQAVGFEVLIMTSCMTKKERGLEKNCLIQSNKNNLT